MDIRGLMDISCTNEDYFFSERIVTSQIWSVSQWTVQKESDRWYGSM